MFNIFWVHVKYILNVVQNTIVYIKCKSTPQEITKLQIILWLNEHKLLFSNEKPKKLVNMKRYIINNCIIVTKIVIKLKR